MLLRCCHLWPLKHVGCNQGSRHSPETFKVSFVQDDLVMIPAFVCLYSRPGPVMSIGVNSDIAKACGIVFTTITLTVPPHPASSGKRTTITAETGRNTEAQRPRYSCRKLNCLKT